MTSLYNAGECRREDTSQFGEETKANTEVCRRCAHSLSLSVQLLPWWNNTSCVEKAKNIHGSRRHWLPGFTSTAGEAAAPGGCSAGEPQPSTSHIPAPLCPAKEPPSCVNSTRQNEDITDLEPCIIYTAQCLRYTFNTHTIGDGRLGWTQGDSCFAGCGGTQRHFIAAWIEPLGIIVCADPLMERERVAPWSGKVNRWYASCVAGEEGGSLLLRASYRTQDDGTVAKLALWKPRISCVVVENVDTFILNLCVQSKTKSSSFEM